MLVNRSLELALRYLRHPTKQRLLWADAVCINQDKIAEKNEAVAQMHLIYHNAQQVIVWLGQPVRPWSFRVILNMPDNYTGTPDYFRGPCQVDNRYNSNVRALLQFGRLPWFARGWVVQEVCFARHIQIQYGRYLLSWEDFEKVAVKLASTLHNFLECETLVKRKTYFAIQEAISGLVRARFSLRKEQGMSLSSLLPFARTKLTTDPRDKIFAFLNLLPAVPTSLVADYGEESRTVFIRTAHLLLREDVGLRLLAECEANPSSQSKDITSCLPSWVPDWAQTRQCESLPGGLSPSAQGHEFSAGTYLLPACNFEIMHDALILEALLWDDIVFLDPFASVIGIDPSINKPLLAHFGIEYDSLPGSFRQISLSNIEIDNYRDFARLCNRVGSCNRDPKGFKIPNTHDTYNLRWAPENHQKIVGRSLMLTSKHYVGWAPPAAALGDVISIIPGCHVPIVLRKVRNSSVVHTNTSSLLDNQDPKDQSPVEMLFSVIGEACKHLSHTCL